MRSQPHYIAVLFIVALATHSIVAGDQLQQAIKSREATVHGSSLGIEPHDEAAAGDSSKANAAAFPAQNKKACRAPYIFRAEPSGTQQPSLQPGRRPNFIVIMTDDQGWDDIGLHNPKYVNTPNLDKFIQRGMLFDNFYTSPQCSQSRASFLTGRHAAKVGTMLVHGGWDFINSGESTAGEVMSQLGYHTAHYGKWHNGRTLGYEAWNVGFNESWFPSGKFEDSLLNNNGVYVQSSEWIDEVLMDKVLAYLGERLEDKQPFFTFYAPHAIHTSRTDGAFKGRVYRSFPKQWREKYDNDSKYDGIASPTKDAWAMLEWLDSILGRLFDYLDSSGLGNSTYVMIMGDNGPQLIKGEEKDHGKQRRMPSNMEGKKSLPYEGGIRNYLAVQGPGVPAGIIDSTMLGLIDILPTMVDLAGNASLAGNSTDLAGNSSLAGDSADLAGNASLADNSEQLAGKAAATASSPDISVSSSAVTFNRVYSRQSDDNHRSSTSVGHLPFDGVSFMNLLLSSDGRQSSARRGTRFASQQQADRFMFTLAPHCWDADAVPQLDENREVDRSQILFDYDQGGVRHSGYGDEIPGMTDTPGFELCIAVRYKQYKWLGFQPGTVYTVYPSHIELPCNSVPTAVSPQLASTMAAAARAWWQTVVDSPFSFTKPVYYLGLGNFTATNIMADGAHERTHGAVKLTVNGATGFRTPGDRMCFAVQVEKAARYSVTLFYTSKVAATFKWSLGPYAAIVAGTAPSITAQLPPMTSTVAGRAIGALLLKSSEGAKWDACLQLVSVEGSTEGGVFKNLLNIRMLLLGERRRGESYHLAARPDQQTSDSLRSAARAQIADDSPSVEDLGSSGQATAAVAAPDIDVHGQYPWLKAALQQDRYTYDTVHALLRHKYRWPRGQSRLESMFSPYDAEDIDWCEECKPGV